MHFIIYHFLRNNHSESHNRRTILFSIWFAHVQWYNLVLHRRLRIFKMYLSGYSLTLRNVHTSKRYCNMFGWIKYWNDLGMIRALTLKIMWSDFLNNSNGNFGMAYLEIKGVCSSGFSEPFWVTSSLTTLHHILILLLYLYFTVLNKLYWIKLLNKYIFTGFSKGLYFVAVGFRKENERFIIVIESVTVAS